MRAAAGLSDGLFDTRASRETGSEALHRQKIGGRTPLSLRPTTGGRQVPDGGV